MKKKKKVIHHSLRGSRQYLENKPQRDRIDNEWSTDYTRKIRLYCENGKCNYDIKLMATWRMVWEEVKPESGRWIRRLSEKYEGEKKGLFKGSGWEDRIKGLTEETQNKISVDTEVVLSPNNCWKHTGLRAIWVAELELSVWELLCVLDHSVCTTLCDLTGSSTPGSSAHRVSPGKNTGVGCHDHLQGIFTTQGLNPGLLHCRQILYHLSHYSVVYEDGI